MRSEHIDEQSAEQLQEVDHPEARIAHRGICASPDAIFGSHRISKSGFSREALLGQGVRNGSCVRRARIRLGKIATLASLRWASLPQSRASEKILKKLR